MDAITSMPKYERVAARVREHLARTNLMPGDQLPSQRTLADELGVSLSTLNKALSVLTSEGRLRKEHGRGTYLAKAPEPNLSRPIALVMEVAVDHLQEHVFYGTLLSELSRLANARGWGFQFFQVTPAKNNPHPLTANSNPALARLIDEEAVGGLILLAWNPYLYLRDLSQLAIPYACLTSNWLEDVNCMVTIDAFALGKAAGNYLIGRGCKSIALADRMPQLSIIEGLRAACLEAGDTVSIRFFTSFEEAVAGADGVFLTDDYYALQQARILMDLPSVERIVVCANVGMHFPRELPRINTNGANVAEALWKSLVAQLDGTDPEPASVLVPPGPVVLPSGDNLQPSR